MVLGFKVYKKLNDIELEKNDFANGAPKNQERSDIEKLKDIELIWNNFANQAKKFRKEMINEKEMAWNWKKNQEGNNNAISFCTTWDGTILANQAKKMGKGTNQTKNEWH